jgi:hypothetical protein
MNKEELVVLGTQAEHAKSENERDSPANNKGFVAIGIK